MSDVTFFTVKRRQKKVLTESPKENLVELIKKTTPGYPAYMTYVDVDGQTKTVSQGFSKQSDGTYVLNRTEIDKYDIYEKTSYTYKNIIKHFSYVDADGIERTFNEYDTLEYDGNSYVGKCGTIKYTNTEVELFVED